MWIHQLHRNFQSELKNRSSVLMKNEKPLLAERRFGFSFAFCSSHSPKSNILIYRGALGIRANCNYKDSGSTWQTSNRSFLCRLTLCSTSEHIFNLSPALDIEIRFTCEIQTEVNLREAKINSEECKQRERFLRFSLGNKLENIYARANISSQCTRLPRFDSNPTCQCCYLHVYTSDFSRDSRRIFRNLISNLSDWSDCEGCRTI